MMSTVYLESLGCARNQVDSEFMLAKIENAGWEIIREPAKAKVIIINTCSFIESAINESIDTIIELGAYKKKGQCRRVVVTGCLPERFQEKILSALPEVDFFLGTGAFDKIVEAISIPFQQPVCWLPDLNQIDPNQSKFFLQESGRPTNRFSVYLKIAEGCSRHCTYCIIPKLRGRQKSALPADILKQAAGLIKSGAREINLVAQDTTRFGWDLAFKTSLEQLLTDLALISNKIWIRFLYGHPQSISSGLIETVAGHDNLCSYFDIPVQHASTPVLKLMGRDYNSKDLYSLFDKIRAAVPGAALRTTLLVGFPGETRQDFNELLDFVTRIKFDHLGVFTYSDFDDLASHNLGNPVPLALAQERKDRIMACQQEISMVNNEKYIDKTLKILVEEHPEENLYIGRSAFQAPEVDGLTYIHTEQNTHDIQIGSFCSVKITDALEYDLIGEAQ